ILNSPNYYDEAPVLSCAEALIRCFDEDLIKKTIFISATLEMDSRKRKVHDRLFYPFLDKSQIFLGEPGRFVVGNKKSRAYLIRQNFPDFDLFIDDSLTNLTETKELFGEDKFYASPDYNGASLTLVGVLILWAMKKRKKKP
ncbi:12213_t:CDS:2, partial [Entrophospora sp. SA101]